MEVVGAVSVCCLPSIMCWICCHCPKAPDLMSTPSSPSLGSPPWPRWRVWQSPQPRKAAARGSADTVIVKVEVHSSSSGAGSDENMSSSDLSERGSGSGIGAGGDHDYEDIYLVRTEAGKTRSNSRDSGSHSRSASLSSNHSNMVVHTHHLVTEDTNSNPEVTSSSTVENTAQKTQQPEIKNCEEQSQKSKTKLNHSHSMPYHQVNSRALKRVVSEPGSALPPPPPPPPPDDLSLTSSPDSSIQPLSSDTLHKAQRSESQSSHTSSSVSVDIGSAEESSTLRASSVSPSKSESPEGATTGAAAAGVEGSSVGAQEAVHAGPNLVNKQMVLPFIPPKFPNTDGDEHSLIKPSEYLRALGNKAHPQPLSAKVEVLPAVHSLQQTEDKTGGAISVVVSAGPPPPPLPEPAVPPARKADQPLGAISIQDLNSVQLRRTSKLTKTMSAPPTSLSGKVEAPFQVAKHDLIEELKKSKDITGIKKMKVEKVKMEEQHEKELVTEIAKQLSVESFVEKIPEKDNTGNPIPPWKRQMLAKKAADKARKEMEEELARQAEEKRLQSIPAWKRQLMQSKKPEDKAPPTCITPSFDDKKMLSSMQIIENENNKPTKENKENSKPIVTMVHKEPEVGDEPAQIIPWRAQLRKTNSTLNLLE